MLLKILYGLFWLLLLVLIVTGLLCYLAWLWCLDGGLGGVVDFIGEHAGDFE